MTTKTTNTTLSASLRIAREMPDAPKITRDTIGRAWLCSDSTAGRILDGAYDEQYEVDNHVLSSPLGEILAGVICCNTPIQLARCVHNADIDGNGKVNKDDVIAGGVRVIQQAASKLDAIRRATPGKDYSPEQRAEINQAAADLASIAGAIVTAVNLLTTTGGPRSA